MEQSRRTGRLGHILRFPLIRILLASLVLLIGVGLAESLLIQPLRAAPSLSSLAAIGWLACYLTGTVAIAIGCYRLYVRIIEQRRADELSSAGALRALGAGGLLGGALFAATLGALWLFGVVRVMATPGWTVVIVALVVDVAGAVFEELLLRGILFRIVEDSVGTWMALAVTVLLFAGLHAGTPDVPVAMIALVGLAGALLPSAAYARTRRLWLPIGIHAGWDLIQSIVSGVSFAGHQVPGVVRLQLAGPPLLTGAGLGLEGSVVAVTAALVLSTYLLVRAARQGQIVQPFWRRTRRVSPALA